MIEKLQKDCIVKDNEIIILKKKSVQQLKKLRKLKVWKTKNFLRVQNNLKNKNVEDVESHEIKTSRLRSVIKGQREEIERLNIHFRGNNINVEDTSARKYKDWTISSDFEDSRKETRRVRNKSLELGLSSEYCSVNLDNDNNRRNELYENTERRIGHQTPGAKLNKHPFGDYL